MLQLRSTLVGAALVGALVIAGCSDSDSTAPGAFDRRPPSGAVVVDTLPLPEAATRWFWFGGGPATPQRLVIHDQAAWAAFWTSVTWNMQPTPPVPEIDFTTSDVIVAAMGLRTTGGFEIAIEEVADTRTQRWVVVNEVTSRNCFTIQAFTYPFDVVRVPKSELPVEWIERQGTFDCPR